jgi:hypothetical protein
VAGWVLARSHPCAPFRAVFVVGVHQRVCRSAEASEAGSLDDVVNPGFSGLRAEGQADLLRQRAGRAQVVREGVVGAPERVEVLLNGVARKRLDDHPGAVRGQRLADVAGGADRVAHVVQAIEHGDQVIALAGESGSGCDLEADAPLQACRLGLLASQLDRALVVVEAGEGRAREGLGHEAGGGSQPAADVGHTGAHPELLGHALQRGQPGRDEVGVVAGPEESFAADVHALVVRVPAIAGATLECALDLGRRFQRGQRQLEGAANEGWARLVSQCQSLLGRQGVAVGARVVLQVAASRLGVQPFADVALCGAGAVSQLGRAGRARPRQAAIEAEPVADDDQAGVDGGAELAHHLPDECHQLVLVDRLSLNCHLGHLQ